MGIYPIRLVIRAIWVISPVEVNQEFSIAQRFRFQIAPRAISFFVRRRVHEWQKEAVFAGVDRQLGFLPLDGKFEPAIARVGLRVAGRRLHLDDFLFGKFFDGDFEPQGRVFWKIVEALEVLLLLAGERAVRAGCEEVIVLGAEGFEVGHGMLVEGRG